MTKLPYYLDPATLRWCAETCVEYALTQSAHFPAFVLDSQAEKFAAIADTIEKQRAVCMCGCILDDHSEVDGGFCTACRCLKYQRADAGTGYSCDPDCVSPRCPARKAGVDA